MIDLSKRLVLLDRDGVINEDRQNYVTKPQELILLSNALRAIAKLSKAGIRVGICTNQGGIARGLYDEDMLAQIHAKLESYLFEFGGKIDNILFCPSLDSDHPYRKPNPGMLLEQARFFDVDLKGVPFVGDNIIDIEAARAAGAQAVLVKTGKGAKVCAKHTDKLDNVLVYKNLEQAVDEWLS